MKKKTAAIIALSSLLAFSVVYGWRQTTLAESYRQQVDSGYRKALYETAELVESMRVNLAKLQITSSASNRRRLLAELALYAEGAQADLASLPANMSFSEGALKFFNQIADFSVSYLDSQEQGENTVGSLLASCEALSDQLAGERLRLEAGETIFLAANGENGGDEAEWANGAALKYPSLLYDGPFSDGREGAELRLAGAELTAEQAQESLRGYIGSSLVEDIRLVAESNTLAPCYEFDVDTADGTLAAAVTKKGGQPLYILCERDPGKRNYSVGECVDFASRFLNQRGYGETRVSYWQLSGAMITVNFAAVQDGVILYPDLVKVDVSMESGNVIGVETANYLSSHKVRDLPRPKLTESQAARLVDRRLNVSRTRLCVIPMEDGSEAFCYEVCAAGPEETYLVYIDAMNGEEVEILKIVETENGQLAV